MLSEVRNGERRALLLERALAGGADLEAALQQAAQAELWLTGALSSAKVLGVEVGYLALPPPEPARADTAGGVVPAQDRVSRPNSWEPPGEQQEEEARGDAEATEQGPAPAAPEAPESEPSRRADATGELDELVLHVIRQAGPAVRRQDVARRCGVSLATVAKVYARLQAAGRLQISGVGRTARAIIVGETSPEEATAPAPKRVRAAAERPSEETCAAVLRAVERLGPEASNGHIGALVGLHATNVSKAVARLVDDGRLKRTGSERGPGRRLQVAGERTAEERAAVDAAVAAGRVRRFEASEGTAERMVLETLRGAGLEVERGQNCWQLGRRRVEWRELVVRADQIRQDKGLEPIAATSGAAR